MPDDLNAKSTIEKAFLEAASPDTVYNWLKERAPPKELHEADIGALGCLRHDQGPEALLDALHARRERLIDLGLAKFCTSPAMLKQLYREGDEALKCAVLSNRFGNIFWMHSRIGAECLFTEEEHEAFARGASLPLLEAYLSNPSLDPEVLEALFLRTEPFTDIDEDRWKRSILYAATNTRLHHDGSWRFTSDGWADYIHRKPMTAAWKLLDVLPVSREWAAILGRLYENITYRMPREIALPPVDESFQEQFVERSRPVELAFLRDVFLKWRLTAEADEMYFGELRRLVAARVTGERSGLGLLPAHLHDAHNEQIRTLLRDHEDLYVRKGYYEQFHPWTSDEVQASYNRDGKRFVEAAIENSWFYQKGHVAARRCLYRLIHEDNVLNNADDAETLRSRYHALGEHWSKEYPQAFEFDEHELARPVDEKEQVATRSSIARVAQQLGHMVYSARCKDNNADDVLEATRRFHDDVEDLEQRYAQQLAQILQGLRAQIDSMRQLESASDRLLFWTLVIGVALVLYFKH